MSNTTLKFLTYFLLNTLILLAVRMYADGLVVFGRLEIGPLQAVFTTAFGLAVAIMMWDILASDFKLPVPKQSYIYSELVVNIVALYVLARTPLQNSVGVGIKYFWVAFVIGAVLSLGQYAVNMLYSKKGGK